MAFEKQTQRATRFRKNRQVDAVDLVFVDSGPGAFSSDPRLDLTECAWFNAKKEQVQAARQGSSRLL
ncbi:hypothetical protein [Desulfonatronum parangueonense]